MAEANGEEKLGLLSNEIEITTRELTSGLPEPEDVVKTKERRGVEN